ncbi:MAG TPA: hypothetical protein VN653_05040 [Anaerolineales bacterium]|nr:hypothetical protein [Anaerolineales bacterium]
MKKKRLFNLMTVVLAVLFAVTSMASVNYDARKPRRGVDPGNFVARIDNPYFPLTPGTTFTFEGESEGAPTRDVMTVARATRNILGVNTTIVHHRSYQDGVLIEDTFDWFAQDEDGNVWYFGEDTRELDASGNVISTEGSWEAGVNGAKPGIIMLADPKKGDRYQQEFAPDIAEDMAQVTGFEDSLCVRYGCFEDVLVTKEWSPLEKGVVELKYYAPGVGFILTDMVKGGDETSELVQVR